ncbi:MAG: copper amine oxidase N-terminal domain-containing protein [Clostridiales bacterium]|jgi:hypothetical protein|nr:copper amine oxidase N-terminal domain-containing protein [Clostridiales bacterium]
MKLRKLLAGFSLGCLLLSAAPATAFAEDAKPITVEIQIGQKREQVDFADQKPVLQDGSTFVPIRGVFEQLGYEISWDQGTQTATLKSVMNTLVIKLGEKTFKANGRTYSLDKPARIIGGRTMLPLRAVLEAASYNLEWDGASGKITITDRSWSKNLPKPKDGDTAPPTKENLQGDWVYTDEKNGDYLAVSFDGGDMAVGVSSGFGNFVSVSGTYTLSGNKVTMDRKEVIIADAEDPNDLRGGSIKPGEEDTQEYSFRLSKDLKTLYYSDETETDIPLSREDFSASRANWEKEQKQMMGEGAEDFISAIRGTLSSPKFKALSAAEKNQVCDQIAKDMAEMKSELDEGFAEARTDALYISSSDDFKKYIADTERFWQMATGDAADKLRAHDADGALKTLDAAKDFYEKNIKGKDA